MFESAELDHRIEKGVFEVEAPKVRQALLEAQFDLLHQARFPLIILIAGVDGAGKGETLNLLNFWMDPRHVQTNVMDAPTQDEQDRPPLWRFWQALAPKGKTGIFFGAWYTQPLLKHVYGESADADLDQAAQEIIRFERMLTNEGVLLLKFWFHLSKKQQRKRLKGLKGDPKNSWRVTETDWKHFKLYDTLVPTYERILRRTSTVSAPWIVVPGAEKRFRSLTVADTIVRTLRKELDRPPVVLPSSPVPSPSPYLNQPHTLKGLEQPQKLSRKEYREQVIKYQRKLNLLSRAPKFKEHAVSIVFEGSDAAGKGGAIRRVTGALDARYWRVVPIAAPTEEERAQPYLWRFWRRLPRRGNVIIFDRSWYGRVLVERVEGFCSETDWKRAYAEINDFEEQMARHGIIQFKFWLSIDKDEQLRRFKERETTELKHYKITEEDWRNREKWEDYTIAVSDMVDRTSTEIAPWTLVPANDKWYARVKVLRTLCDGIEAALKA